MLGSACRSSASGSRSWGVIMLFVSGRLAHTLNVGVSAFVMAKEDLTRHSPPLPVRVLLSHSHPETTWNISLCLPVIMSFQKSKKALKSVREQLLIITPGYACVILSYFRMLCRRSEEDEEEEKGKKKEKQAKRGETGSHTVSSSSSGTNRGRRPV